MRIRFALNPASPITCALMALITLGLMIGAVVSGWDNVRYFGAPTVPGTVVEHEYFPFVDDNGKTSDGWKIIVEWTDQDGDTIRTPSRFASSSPHEIGSSVDVQYLPGDQGKVRIATWAEKWLASTILGGIGLAFALFTAFCLWHYLRWRRVRRQMEANPMWSEGYPPTEG